MRLPRVRTITKERIKARLQILPLLSRNELLTPKLLRQKLRISVLVLRLFSMFTVFVFFFFKDLYFVLIINEDTFLLFCVL